MVSAPCVVRVTCASTGRKWGATSRGGRSRLVERAGRGGWGTRLLLEGEEELCHRAGSCAEVGSDPDTRLELGEFGTAERTQPQPQSLLVWPVAAVLREPRDERESYRLHSKAVEQQP